MCRCKENNIDRRDFALDLYQEGKSCIPFVTVLNN